MSRYRAIGLSLAIVLAPAAARTSHEEQGAVVRIVNYAQRGDWSLPWVTSSVTTNGGSGFVIKNGLVMTNAHVVSDSRMVLIHFSNDPNPHEAEVLYIGHDCDLALLRPRDPKTLQGIKPLTFGALPELGSSVETLGYPTGGLRVSSTRGVVSRIEEQIYVHSAADGHLAGQTDAAINPGSSGGPVVQNGRVVGVAFQTDSSLQSVGFFIPGEVIERFLRDVADGHYDGYPDLGLDYANMEHPAARVRVGMRDGETGVRVSRTIRGSSAQGIIRIGDVILAVNGRKVANDGSVADGPDRIPVGMLIDRMFIGQKVLLNVLRDSQRFDVEVPLVRNAFLDARRNAYDETPRYFVYGGLVFVPLSRETMETYGDDWPRKASPALLEYYTYRVVAKAELQDSERVVLIRRLDDPVNAEMAWFQDQVVERVNGIPITSLPRLIEAFEQFQGDFDVIEFAHGRRFGVLDRKKAEAANPSILERYGIQRDRAP